MQILLPNHKIKHQQRQAHTNIGNCGKGNKGMGWVDDGVISLNINSFVMQSTNRSGLQCYEHPREQITNFCVQADCLKPLCPDCVEIHTKSHQRQEIQSWKHCVNRSASQTKAVLDELRAIYEGQRQGRSFKSVEVVESENVRKLGVLRERVHRAVDDAFNAHENALRAHIRSQYRIDQTDTSQLKMAIEQMEKVLLKLSNSSTVLPALKKCLLLDHKALLQHFRPMKAPVHRNINENFFSEPANVTAQVKALLQRCIAFESFAPQTQILPDSKYSSPGQYRKQSAHGLPSSDPFEPIRISCRDYFQPNCRNKLLHFFIPCSQELKVLRVEEARTGNWTTLNFKSSSELPSYFKSIITPAGEIYLTGGSNGQQKYNQIYKYNFDKNSLQIAGRMTVQRSSHSICFAANTLFIIGGFSQAEGEVTRQCQAFNLQTRQCTRIAPLNTPSANSCAAAFNDELIFKFGGIYNRSVNENSKIIEMYSIKNNRWVAVTVDMPRNVPTLQLLSFSAAVQINQSEILVFGGYDNTQAEKPDRICYTLQVNMQRKTFSVRNYNTTPLPYAEAFWDNNPIIHDGAVYALQNITDQQDELTAIADERRVIIFNGENWS